MDDQVGGPRRRRSTTTYMDIQELTLDSAGPTDTSTEQFGYVLGLVGPYISRLPTVYTVIYTWQCMRRDALRRTTSYNVGRLRTTSYATTYAVRRTQSYAV